MKLVPKWMKYILFAVILAALITVSGPAMTANAASGAINVTNAMTGQKLYSGDDLQEAFDAAERGSIVTVARYITLTQDVTLRVEIMLKGYNFIRFVPDANDTSVYYKLQLAEEGAIFVDSRIRTKYIGTLHSYSEVDMVQENGGYVYYIVAQAPDFDGSKPVVTAGEGVYGAKVDAEAGVIYFDISPKGVTQSALAQCITMQAKNTEKVAFTFQSEYPGADVATGGTMVATATNVDYDGKVTVSYHVIVIGDVNGNGVIDAADAALIARFSTGVGTLEGDALLAADANRDGLVNAKDAKLICEKYVRADTYKSPLQQ